MYLFAVRNLLSRPARTSLVVLGLAVAIAGMVGLFSIAHGLDVTVKQTFARVPGLVALQPGAPIPLFSTLPREWGNEIVEMEGVRVVNPEVWQRVNVINDQPIISPPRFFCGTEIKSRNALNFDIFRDSLTDGRFLTQDDRGTSNCVVSRYIADQFQSKVGDVITPNGVPCTIIGIYEVGSMLVDVAIVMDIDVVRDITRYDPKTVSAYYIEPEDTDEKEVLAENIRQQFADRTVEPWRPSSAVGLAPDIPRPLARLLQFLGNLFAALEENNRPITPTPPKSTQNSDTKTSFTGHTRSGIDVRSMDDWSRQFDQLTGELDLFITILTSVGLLIAVLSIVNTMLMSVSERIVEFGILKSNGWSHYDVMKLITLESCFIGICGGIIGAIVGWAATLILNANFPDKLNLYAGPELLTFSVCFSAFLGILGGLYPAIWAVRLAPMEAIRRG
ncbi:ABC transporter permease [Calycomorphotria hydatis]|uniref:ABC transporter permease YtrF n=1 Tax=Calycomorphotria hydatis TaxID=2528027 RepID=A0A517T591_9PLAN|nr:ABC transporter permease [Calycomorphotria hydatis]QDT63545.1 ABC transporter permease YtrF precursor [Calycomorphotria hydatis]